jgi:hypothetical protein
MVNRSAGKVLNVAATASRAIRERSLVRALHPLRTLPCRSGVSVRKLAKIMDGWIKEIRNYHRPLSAKTA